MAFKTIFSNQFNKKYKLMLKRGKDGKKLEQLVNLIKEGANNGLTPPSLLPSKYRLHKLSGNYSNLWECHLEPDWLVIFDLNDETLILENTGTHSDLFK